MTHAASLRTLLKTGEMVVAPGAFDGITGRMVASAGFPAVYMTGAGTSMTLGYPDYGLITMTEMVANAQRIVHASDLPLISDADTGYGNELNVWRTVQEFERAGVAAIHIEDQAFPKKCGHLDDKELASREDFAAKIRAAAAARRSPDFTIIARTDARGPAGLDEAIARGNLALAAGADMIFVEAPQSMEEVAAVPRLIKGPCLFNMVRGGKSPDVSIAEARQMGFAVSIVPGLLLRGIVETCDALLSDLREDRFPPDRSSPGALFARFDAAEWDERRTAYRDSSDGTPSSCAAAE
ncbi:2-Methylisocitrate lyase, PEP mutase family [Albimonas donghaensis]|uniref:2-Methylisocitrate lyase, PEP mutase family n=1 Tax=Albimonas donghaensis TaxID=356660 RepID=A0A1H3DQV7_9RHOB|nr:isocitrate lyase/PEP mutase family protein [Albimonas donghaensis]SDX68786.1 2-Methylisocitrate lyase, PEP mutase family [Albimonas donghaensis]